MSNMSNVRRTLRKHNVKAADIHSLVFDTKRAEAGKLTRKDLNAQLYYLMTELGKGEMLASLGIDEDDISRLIETSS